MPCWPAKYLVGYAGERLDKPPVFSLQNLLSLVLGSEKKAKMQVKAGGSSPFSSLFGLSSGCSEGSQLR